MRRSFQQLMWIGLVTGLGQGAASAQTSGENATGQPGPAGGIQDIVVTAQRRSESAQRVPVAITAFGADQLQKSGISDLQGIAASVPNFNFGAYNGNAQLAIRGLGYDSVNPGAEGRVAVHLDGVYVSRPAAALNAFYDVDRLEVLRGPQGTLYGRNATAGSVNIITKNPTDVWSGYVRGTAGNYSSFNAEGAIGGPLTDGLSFRVAGRVEDRGGYGKNIITGNDIDNARTRSARGKLRYQSGNFDWIVSADYHRENDNNNALHFFGAGAPGVQVVPLRLGAIAPANNRDIAQDRDPTNKRTFWGVASDAKLDLAGVTIRSITGYRSSEYRNTGTFDAVSGSFDNFVQFERSKTLSEELQVSHNGGRLNWLIGGYYFHERDNIGNRFFTRGTLFGLPNEVYQGYFGGGESWADAAAIFGQATWKIAPRLSLTVGERLGWERKRKYDLAQFDLTRIYNPDDPIIPTSGPERGQTSDYYQSPKASLEYQMTPRALVYATYARGYKSGGFDIGGVGPAFKPETLDDYEVGAKSQFFDNRLRVNLSAFYYDYKNIQIAVVRNTIIRVENAASSTLYGAEAEISALLTSNLRIDFSAGYLHSKYKNYVTTDTTNAAAGLQDLSGNQLTQAPKFNSDVGIEYSFDLRNGRAALRADWKHRSKVYYTAFESDINSSPKNDKLDLSLNWEDATNHWSASVWGKNVTNEKIRAYSVTASEFMGFPVIGYLQPPATYGVTVGYKF